MGECGGVRRETFGDTRVSDFYTRVDQEPTLVLGCYVSMEGSPQGLARGMQSRLASPVNPGPYDHGL